jgi:hypothetical protein
MLRERLNQRELENREYRRIIGPKMWEVRGNLRNLHNEEFYVLYSSPDIIRVINSSTMR